MIDQFIIEFEGSRYLKINDDPDLSPIMIKLPDPPSYEFIDGSKLPVEKQLFRRTEMPIRLQNLNFDILKENGAADFNDDDEKETGSKSNYSLAIKEVLAMLEDPKNQRIFREEINFIKREHYRSDHGYWTTINGKPFWLTPSHYKYLNSWDINSTVPGADGKPEYRFRDWMFFIVIDWSQKHPKILGILYFKHRREGATSKATCDWYFKGIKYPRRIHGMQSKSEKSAKKFWREFITAWSKLPFYDRPEWSGNNMPKKELHLVPKAQSSTKSGVKAQQDHGLGSYYDWRIPENYAYDGDKLHYKIDDEIFKKEKNVQYDSYERHLVDKETMIEGDEIIGYKLGLSTVGDDDDDVGGLEFAKKFRESSKYWGNNLDNNGFTISGMYPYFLPSEINLGGYSDIYGNPIVEDPLTPLMNSMGVKKTNGAASFLTNKTDALREKKDYSGLNNQLRKFPRKFVDCFRSSSEKTLFNQQILNDVCIKLSVSNPTLLRGRIEPKNSLDKFGPMQFVIDESGNWMFSQQPEAGKDSAYWLNDQILAGNRRVPLYANEYTVSFDATKYEKTLNRNKSMAAITVKRTHNPNIDPFEKSPDTWITDCYVADYLDPGDDHDAYAYEILKAAILWSTGVYGEGNVDHPYKWMQSNGFHGYCQHQVKDDGRINPNPGYQTQISSKQSMFADMASFINRRAAFDKHVRIWEQAKDIQRFEDLKRYDLLSSAMGNLRAEKNLYPILAQSKDHTVGIDYWDYNN